MAFAWEKHPVGAWSIGQYAQKGNGDLKSRADGPGHLSGVWHSKRRNEERYTAYSDKPTSCRQGGSGLELQSESQSHPRVECADASEVEWPRRDSPVS